VDDFTLLFVCDGHSGCGFGNVTGQNWTATGWPYQDSCQTDSGIVGGGVGGRAMFQRPLRLPPLVPPPHAKPTPRSLSVQRAKEERIKKVKENHPPMGSSSSSNGKPCNCTRKPKGEKP
jgi:hypothetical protein